MRVRGTATVLRSSSLIALGALGVHQLRYLLAYGGGTTQALREQGHAYLTFALPLVAAAALSLVAGTLIAAAHGRAPASTPRTRRLGGWACCAVALLGIFVAQELVEGILAGGHPAGPAAFLANGGWLALPLAVAFGGLVARLLRGIDLVQERLAAPPTRRPRSPLTTGRARPRAGRALGKRVLALGLACRPPPVPA
jgi:hypothetical protein